MQILRTLFLVICLFQTVLAENQSLQKAQKLSATSNYQEAYNIYEELIFHQSLDTEDLTTAISMALQSLNMLGKSSEIDNLREQVISKYQNDFRVIQYLADNYLNYPSHGSLQGTKFLRGAYQPGNYTNSAERDWVRSLQLYQLALDKFNGNIDEQASLFRNYASRLKDSRTESLYFLTNLEKLPAYGTSRHSATVLALDNNGKIFIPEASNKFSESSSDFARWIWLNTQLKNLGGQHSFSADFDLAELMSEIMGIDTVLSNYQSDESEFSSLDNYKVYEFNDSETLCKTGLGTKKITIPEKYNFIKLLKNIVVSNDPHKDQSIVKLAAIYESRKQYSQALEYYELIKTQTQPSHRIRQITQAFARFSEVPNFLPGKNKIKIKYRNSNQIEFVTLKLDVAAYIEFIEQEIQSKSDNEEYYNSFANELQPHSLLASFRENKLQNFLSKHSSWSIPVISDSRHFDKELDIELPELTNGVYVMQGKTEDNHSFQTLIYVNDELITREQSQNNNLAFITDAKNGTPHADKQLEYISLTRDYSGRRVKSLISRKKLNSDAQGLVNLPSCDNSCEWLLFDSLQHSLLISSGNYIYDNSQKSNFHKLYVTTSRTVYKPGDTVQIKAILKEINYANPIQNVANQNISLEIYDGLGNSVYKTNLKTDEEGAIDTSYNLAVDAKLGDYSVNLSSLSSSSVTFTVEEYKKPEMELELQTPEKLVLGDIVELEAKAKYYFGADVTKGKVNYKIYRSVLNSYVYPFSRWDWLYGNGCFFEHSYKSIIHNSAPEILVAEGSGNVSDGSFKFKLDTSDILDLAGTQDYSYRVEVELEDESRRQVRSQKVINATRNDFRLLMRSDAGYYQVGSTIKINIDALDANAKELDIAGSLVIEKITENPDLNEAVQITKLNFKTDESDNYSLSYELRESGTYRLRATAVDSRGKTVTEEIKIFVLAGEKVEAAAYADLELKVDRNEYKVGDAIDLKIFSKYQDAQAIVYYGHQGREYQFKTIRLNSGVGSLKLLVEKQHQPNTFIKVVLVGNAQVYREVKRILVPPETKILNIQLQTDKLKYQPSETADFSLKLLDLNQKPLAGVFSLTAFDKSLEYIKPDDGRFDISKFFWGDINQELSLPEIDSQTLIPEGISYGTERMEAINGLLQPVVHYRSKGRMGMKFDAPGGMADGMLVGAVVQEKSLAMDSEAGAPPVDKATAANPVKIRKDFADQLVWEPKLKTDANGNANLKVKLPDNLTTWKVVGLAYTEDDKVAYVSSEFVTTKDMLVRLQHPDFLVAGDTFTASCNLHNYSEYLETVDLRINADSKKYENLTSKSEVRLDSSLKVEEPGELTLLCEAKGLHNSDAMQETVPVLTYGSETQQTYSAALDIKTSTRDLNFKIPEDSINETRTLTLSISPSIALAAVDALPYLIKYEYGCVEQTLNRFLPALAVKNTLNKLGIKLEDLINNKSKLPQGSSAAPHEDPAVNDLSKLQSVIAKYHAELLSMQNSDGGWAWFSGYDVKSDAYFTAYVLDGLITANNLGLTTNIDSAVSWLQNYQVEELAKIRNYPSKTLPYKEKADDLDSFVYVVLSRVEKTNPEMLNKILDVYPNLALLTKAKLAYALGVSHPSYQDLLRNLKQFEVEDPENQTLYLRDSKLGYYWHDDEVELNASYLLLLLQQDKIKEASTLVKYLVANREYGAHWKSTRDTAAVVNALTTYLNKTNELSGNITGSITLDSNKIADFNVSAAKDGTFELNIPYQQLAAGAHKLSINLDTGNRAYASAFVQYFSTERKIPAQGLDLKVNRKFYKINKAKKQTGSNLKQGTIKTEEIEYEERIQIRDGEEIKVGDLIESELTIDTKNDFEQLIFKDYKPAGTVAYNLLSGYDYKQPGIYFEYLKTKTAMFINNLKRGTSVIKVRLRAETPGIYQALPAKAQLMYVPRIKGNSENFGIEIKD